MKVFIIHQHPDHKLSGNDIQSVNEYFSNHIIASHQAGAETLILTAPCVFKGIDSFDIDPDKMAVFTTTDNPGASSVDSLNFGQSDKI